MFSPSSLASLELCPRKFAWDRIDKVPRTPNRFATFGIKVHSHVEAYYLHGVMPNLAEPEGNSAVALLSHLPPPQPGVRVEEHRILGRFHGYPDLTLGPKVFDHKTCGSFDYALTPQGLLENLQAALYAHFVMQETGELRVQLQWNYVTRERRPRVLPVIQEATFGGIARTLDRAAALADQGQTILDGQIPALELEPNPHACEKFGGCEHRLRCNLTPGQQMLAHLETDMSDAADFMSEMKKNHAPGAPPPPPPAGNPWDGLPATHVRPDIGQWYDAAGGGWKPMVTAAPPPPPAPVPVNPPPPAATAPQSPPAPPAAPTPPQPHAGSPTAVLAPPGPPPPTSPEMNQAAHDILAPLAAGAPAETTPHEKLALALEAAADAVREIGGKRGPGRPRKKP